MLENAGKSELDCTREGFAGGTIGAAIDCSSSIVTSTMIQASVSGAADSTAAAPSSPATPPSMDGTSGSIVGADNIKTGSKSDTDGTSDFLTDTDEAATRSLFGGQKGPASDAAFFLAACRRISAADTRVLSYIAAIRIKKLV